MMRVYEEYDESGTKGLISLDIDNLHIEVHNQSQIVYDFRMYLAVANKKYSIAKAKLERRKASLASEIRLNPSDYGIKPPDFSTQVKETVAASPEIEELENEVIDTKFVIDKLWAALEALSDKSYSIGHAVKLALRNYYADNPITEEERKLIESEDYEEVYDKLNKIMTDRRKKE